MSIIEPNPSVPSDGLAEVVDDAAGDASAKATGSKRVPGARRTQILQTLAEMLEHPKAERVTTAALAAKLEVSEAALYRHFASKAQMFEGLMEFIESTLFGLINQISAVEPSGLRQCKKIIAILLSFAEKNRGMTRVLIGDALVNENERLQQRMNQLVERVEASFRQCLRQAVSQNELSPQDDLSARANLMAHFVLGRWHRYAKSGFKKVPTEFLEAQVPLLLT